MQKSAVLCKIKQFLDQKKAQGARHVDTSGAAGYTLIEVLVVVLLIGVIAAIAAPGWLGFVQQRRVNKANDIVLGALQEAQSQAKKTKLSYSVVFRNRPGEVPALAVYPTKGANGQPIDPTNPSQLPEKAWKSVGEGLELKPGQVTLGTNLNAENQANQTNNNFSYSLNNNADIANKRITFDYQGTVPVNQNQNPNLPLIIAVATPKGHNDQTPIESLIRCVKVTTLLGTITTGRSKAECGG